MKDITWPQGPHSNEVLLYIILLEIEEQCIRVNEQFQTHTYIRSKFQIQDDITFQSISSL